MGRLTKTPELRYTSNNKAVCKYTLAVNRRFKPKNVDVQDVDFINCVVFGKAAEFAEKNFQKGQMISVVGRLQVQSWKDNDGNTRWSTDVIVEEQYFAGNKGGSSNNHKSNASANTTSKNQPKQQTTNYNNTPDGGFYPIDETIEDDDLPF